jgi:transcriptional regulator with XRE-family HTH domain
MLERYGMSERAIAEAAGVASSTVSRIKSGQLKPSRAVAQALLAVKFRVKGTL